MDYENKKGLAMERNQLACKLQRMYYNNYDPIIWIGDIFLLLLITKKRMGLTIQSSTKFLIIVL